MDKEEIVDDEIYDLLKNYPSKQSIFKKSFVPYPYYNIHTYSRINVTNTSFAVSIKWNLTKK